MEPWGLINLRGAYLVRADLRGARLPNAQLSGTQLNRANLFDAQLNGADLSNTQLNGAKFLTKAELRGVLVTDLDFTDVTITREQLHEMFGDASVILPEALQPTPAHWPTVKLRWDDGPVEWKRWLEGPDRYAFDPTRYGDRYTDQTGE